MMAEDNSPTDEPVAREPAGPSTRRPVPHPSITEEMIETLVRAFYGRVREDPDLAPIFDRVIEARTGGDWEPHLRTMMDFWSSVTLMSGRYHGQPMRKHMAIPDLGSEHFARWLELFRLSAQEVTPPDAAAFFIDRAQRIALSLSRGIAFARGQSIAV